MSSTETEKSPAQARERRGAGRAFFLRLHFYAAVFVGPFLLIAAISGGLYAISPSLEQLMYRDYLRTTDTGPALPLSEQVRAAQHLRPDLTVTAVRPADGPGETTRVLFSDPTLGPSERHAVFIDPATAASHGELTVYGNSGALPIRTWIGQLHRSLHLGDPGRIYSELAASWLGVIALAGVYLWLSRYRHSTSQGSARARLLTVDRSASGRRRTLGWHGAVGIWIAVGLVFLSATGLTWSTYAGANVDQLRAALSWTTPAVSKALDGDVDPTPSAGGHDHGAGAVSPPQPAAPKPEQLDRVLQSARAAGIGGKVEVSIPPNADTAFTVTQTRQPWVMSNNSVAVNGDTGEVTDVLWFADWPLAAKLAAWGIQLHMGTLFGLVNQLAMLALATALVTVIVRGYLMWWRRRPTKGERAVGRPPRRGALAALPAPAAVAVVLAAVTVGWFVPLLGISLAAFVAVDALLAVRQNRMRPVRP
ncbi:PepSY domain-containing protein [Mycobacterium sp. MBM]|nr:PepSY domain-containing protein [Mycobacterium sp. MBM]